MDVDGGNWRGYGERTYPPGQDHEIRSEFLQELVARPSILGIDVMDRKIMRCCDQFGVAGAMHHQGFDFKGE